MNLIKNKYKIFWYPLICTLVINLSSCSLVSGDKTLEHKTLKGNTENFKRVLILLHDQNNDIEMWKPFIPKIPDYYLVIGAQAPYKATDSTYQWFEMDSSKKPYTLNDKELTASTNKVKNLINTLSSSYEVEKEQITIAGFGQGGIVCYQLAIRHSTLVRNIAIFSGMLPNGQAWNTTSYPDLSTFIAHGTTDRIIGLKKAKKAKTYFQNHGARVKMAIDNSAHYISQDQFKSFVHWLE